MKKRGLILLAAGALTAAAAFAQTTVTSQNAVGFEKLSTAAGKWHMLGWGFDTIDKTSSTLTIGQILGKTGIPDGTLVAIWNGRYAFEAFDGVDAMDWVPGTNLLVRGDGFWINPPETLTNTIAGEVPGASYAAVTTNVLSQGYQMITYPYPVAISVTNTSLSSIAADGDQVIDWKDGYKFYQYDGVDGVWRGPLVSDVNALVFQPGQGYWYYKIDAGTVTWVENKPYNWP